MKSRQLFAGGLADCPIISQQLRSQVPSLRYFGVAPKVSVNEITNRARVIRFV